jgi:biopolymer transport protein ExbD
MAMAKRLTGSMKAAAPFHAINLTPMVPVLLAVVAVVAITTTETPVAKLDSPPGDCFGVASCEANSRIFVNFTGHGEAVVDGRVVPAARAPELVVALSRTRPEASIAIRADADVPYAQVFRVFKAVDEAGLRAPALVNEDLH